MTQAVSGLAGRQRAEHQQVVAAQGADASGRVVVHDDFEIVVIGAVELLVGYGYLAACAAEAEVEVRSRGPQAGVGGCAVHASAVDYGVVGAGVGAQLRLFGA